MKALALLINNVRNSLDLLIQNMLTKETISFWFQSMQNYICKGLEELDGKAKFTEDNWKRKGGGGGRTRVIENGAVFEKGGVNFSAVHGEAPDFLKKDSHSKAADFFATGVSLVIHPASPVVPIIHMNVRYFEMGEKIKWFGGGIDLTPIYVNADDAIAFHQQLKDICDKYDARYYREFKKWADEYFFINHRNETRGIGGIFFDKLTDAAKHSLEQRFNFVKAVGESFLPIYSDIVNRNRDKKYSEKQKQWQLLRRGRYVEFNLVYDRGTKFGLETQGRTESILMSLPNIASWTYNYVPEKGSAEEKTVKLLKKGINWV
jgi:coproporphyrinogen III oxidase